jgi:hypothetical protein
LFEAVYRIESGEMPPKSYALLHPESRVTPVQLVILKQYLSAQPRQRTLHSTGQDDSRPHSSAMPTDVHPSRNGK